MINYKFSPSILDRFEGYINSSKVYQQYYGFSEEPSITEEEFEQKKFQELIDGINKVPMKWEDSEAADKGTAFNEVVDCLIENRQSEKVEVKRIYDNSIETTPLVALKATYNKRTFHFPITLVREFADYCKGAVTQQYCEAPIETKYGNVLLYGYMDEVLPFKIIDIKTTGKYNAFKYRNYWQRFVYPYCLKHSGMSEGYLDFEFLITDFRNTWVEMYDFNPAVSIPYLKEHCEAFIEFIEANKHLITNPKIFAKA